MCGARVRVKAQVSSLSSLLSIITRYVSLSLFIFLLRLSLPLSSFVNPDIPTQLT